MGSRLSRQNSLDNENFSKRRRKHLDSTGESDRSGDFLFTSLMLRTDKLPGVLRRANHSPYVRRVAWIREIQKLLQERKIEEATDVLKLLRKVRANVMHCSINVHLTQAAVKHAWVWLSLCLTGIACVDHVVAINDRNISQVHQLSEHTKTSQNEIPAEITWKPLLW